MIKTWRLQNVGDCTLEDGATLVFLGGEIMGNESEIPISVVVLPGQTFDISVQLQAPELPGSYQGEWGVKTNKGSLISALQLSVKIQVK